jgi:hypothetical protein
MIRAFQARAAPFKLWPARIQKANGRGGGTKTSMRRFQRTLGRTSPGSSTIGASFLIGVVPDGKGGEEAFAVIRDAMKD